METSSTYGIELITRYFSGEATEDEILRLSEWLKESNDHQVLFNEYRLTWQALEKTKIQETIEVESEWKKFNFRKAADELRKADEKPVIRINRDRGTSSSSYLRLFRIAAILIVLAVSSVVLYRIFDTPEQKILTAQTTTLESKLPDGTSVTLNAGTTLSYPSEFSKSHRDVSLKGEAYFNVTHDAQKPFIIEADGVMIEVLGTSFYVNTNPTENNVTVILSNGKVAVYRKNSPSERTIMAPGDKVEMPKTSAVAVKTVNDDQNFLAWKTHEFIFNNERLDNIISKLNLVYRSQIKLENPELANCLLTATFSNQSLDAVLKVIEATLDIKIKKSGSQILISGKGCS
ncbi:MAG: FecR domain-containing protein [Bacteroidota bacterium]